MAAWVDTPGARFSLHHTKLVAGHAGDGEAGVEGSGEGAGEETCEKACGGGGGWIRSLHEECGCGGPTEGE